MLDQVQQKPFYVIWMLQEAVIPSVARNLEAWRLVLAWDGLYEHRADGFRAPVRGRVFAGMTDRGAPIQEQRRTEP